jgi:hypothetical protein
MLRCPDQIIQCRAAAALSERAEDADLKPRPIRHPPWSRV